MIPSSAGVAQGTGTMAEDFESPAISRAQREWIAADTNGQQRVALDDSVRRGTRERVIKGAAEFSGAANRFYFRHRNSPSSRPYKPYRAYRAYGTYLATMTTLPPTFSIPRCTIRSVLRG